MNGCAVVSEERVEERAENTPLRCAGAQAQSGQGVGSYPEPLWPVPEEVQHPCAQRAAES